MQKVIVYNHNGAAFNDFTVVQLAKEFLDSKYTTKITVSTENFIHAVRLMVALGKYSPDKIRLYYYKTGRSIYIRKTGELSENAEGFADFTASITRQIEQAVGGKEDDSTTP